MSTNTTDCRWFPATPEAPTSLQTLSRTWESIYLQWTAGFNGGYPQQFQIQYQELGASDKAVVPAQPLSVTEFNVTGEEPAVPSRSVPGTEFSITGKTPLQL